MLYQTALLLIVIDAFLVAPVTTPPLAPCVFSGGPTVFIASATFFSGSGAFHASASAATAISNSGDDTATAEDA
jgi:hypothetical protein